jgi:shikimate 5-dehydrogenase
MKWAEITTDSRRAQCLSEYLGKQGFQNSLTCVEPGQDPAVLLQNLQKEQEQIRFAPSFGASIIQGLPHQPILENQIRMCDTLVFDHGKWWPRSFLSGALEQALGDHKKDLKMDSDALILGTGAVARCTSAALFKAGLRRFLVTGPEEEAGQSFCKTMSRHLLGAQFYWTPRRQIVSLPGECGVVVNATPVRDDNEILKDLLYFNFIRTDGIVWDFSLQPLSHPFIEEASALQITVVRGFQMAARVDQSWAAQVLKVEFDRLEYEKLLFSKLS